MTPEMLVALSTFIASLVSSAIALIAARRAGLAATNASQVKDEVKTMNELTLGQLGEASETRRIDKIPVEDRTAQEIRHTVLTEDDDVPRPPGDDG